MNKFGEVERRHRDARVITDFIKTTAGAVQTEQQKVACGIDVDVGDKIQLLLRKKRMMTGLEIEICRPRQTISRRARL